MTLGDRIKKARLQKDWRQSRLAKEAHVRLATLCEIENNIRLETRTDIARRLAKALGVTVDWLVGMYEDDREGQCEPAGVAMVGASAHAGSGRVLSPQHHGYCSRESA